MNDTDFDDFCKKQKNAMNEKLFYELNKDKVVHIKSICFLQSRLLSTVLTSCSHLWYCPISIDELC